ncbi:hypothetical protein [Glaciecola sp. 33A]|jgi:glycosyltransferase involved in cell wall biosynthesis|uniref:hypothetical protein n=1 Tax=Glaciecola sp. 33A TaxID=2057807 RepID=UPI000C333564|nr:hypothetical protein [Glaciecola sp. 33A]PKI02286.1 hypothetical protein CXF81_06390 [Glaciecola sp. 33A]
MNMLYFINHELLVSNGVSKKIYAQVDAIKSYGHNVELCCIKKSGRSFERIVGSEVIEKFYDNVIGKIVYNYSFSYLYNYIRTKKIDCIYIRYTHFASPMFVSFLKKIKRLKVKVYLEIPTYPYDKEFKYSSAYKKTQIYIDKIFRRRLGKYIDKIITFSNDEYIWGVKTLKISNAVSKSNVFFKQEYSDSHVINLVMVAYFAKWHGLDRLFQSYDNTPLEIKQGINIHVIGYGPELDKLQESASKDITFHGALAGIELGSILNRMQIGIDSLARHRVGVYENNSLKSKEYLAYGLPVVKSHIDRSIDSLKHVYTVDSNDSLLDLAAILTWYQENNFCKSKISSLALEKFTWEHQLKEIFHEKP